jgi:hypothetical protein
MKINNFINKNLYKIILVFLFIQPFIDVLAGISINYLKINLNISSIIRLIFLMFCIYYLIFINKDKKCIKYLCSYFIYLFIYIIIVYVYKDVSVLSYEIKNNLNIFYFPIVFLGLYNMFINNNIKIKLKYFVYLYFIYILFIIIPDITHTAFNSYEYSKLGNIGWFLSANTIGSILSLLLPLLLIYMSNKKYKNIFKILIILSLYVFFTIGTKVPVLSIFIIVLVNLIYFIIKWFKDKLYKNIIIVFTTFLLLIGVLIIFIPKTTFYKNLEIHRTYLGLNSYLEVFSKEEYIDHFIFSQRLTFLKNTHSNYMNSNIPSKLFGIGFIENYGTDDFNIKTIEIDYFEIFYRSGIIGFIIYFILFIPLLVKSFKKLKNINFVNIQYLNILILVLLLAFFQGHILITPSVSIYVSLFIIFLLNDSLDID